MPILHFCSKLFLVGFILTLSFGMRGQNQLDIKSLLSQSEYSKYQKAEKIISKGSEIINLADSSRMITPSSSQAQRECDLKKEQAYFLFRDGYDMKLRILNGYLEDYMNKHSEFSESDKQKVVELQLGINEGVEKSKKIYAQSCKTSKLSKSIKMQEEALQIQLNAINSAEKGLLLVQDFKEEMPVTIISKEPPHEEVVESIPEVVATVAAKVVVTEKKMEKKPVIEEEKPIETDVYFTIQVLADKKPATVVQQKMVYKGLREVIENIGGGWYRYSVGKFKSYPEAVSAMKTEGVNGFVVAYDGSERVTTSEAKKILGGEK